ncbi:MAG TPA: hypothetical protein VM840_10715 [Actinomycetota bacterium]|jgi:hypothetical protein|nr:hypothetical protein [Actinomycetota bacterium]
MATTKPKTFPQALASLLRSRKLKVPPGLESAPPEAYANQPPEVVDQLTKLPDDRLLAQAQHVAGYAKRREARVKASWEGSPLIKEMKRRKLKVPAAPTRVVGAALSYKRPLREWSDAELVEAAKEWSRRGR